MLLGSITPYIGSDPGSHRHHLVFMLRHLTDTVGMVIARALLAAPLAQAPRACRWKCAQSAAAQAI
jgi:hypothetical protein